MIRDLEATLGRLLTWGTRATTTMLCLGVLAAFVNPAAPLTGVLLTSGLVILLVMPFARVVVSVIGFVLARDWWFVLFTSIVMALLIGSFAAAFGF